MDFLDELRRQGSLESTGRFWLPQPQHPLSFVLPLVAPAEHSVRVTWRSGRLTVERDGEQVLDRHTPEPDFDWLRERLRAAPIDVEVGGRPASTGVRLGQCLIARELGCWEGLFRLERPLQAVSCKRVENPLKGVLTLGRRVFSDTNRPPRLTVVLDKMAFPVEEELPEVGGVIAAVNLRWDGGELVKDRDYYRMLKQLSKQLAEMDAELEELAEHGSGSQRALARRVLEKRQAVND